MGDNRKKIYMIPHYSKIGDSHTECRTWPSRVGVCFEGAHTYEIAKFLGEKKDENVVVYLGTNDATEEREKIAGYVTHFLQEAQKRNVHILAWVGPSIPISGMDAGSTDVFFRSLLGNIPYVSMLDSDYPHVDYLHLTSEGYARLKEKVDKVIQKN